MELYYEKLQANITPETLAQLKHNKNHIRKHEPRKLKGRYSIVVFDSYGKVTLDNKQLQIITQQKKETKTEKPYQYLKEFVNSYYADIEDQTLQELPFISGLLALVALI